MRRTLALIFIAGSALTALAQSRPGLVLKIDAGAFGAAPFTWYGGGPLLPHAALAADMGLSLAAGESLRAKLEAGLFKVWPSIPSRMELYRGWEGARFAVLAGWGTGIGPGELEILGGVAAGAAYYSGTPLVFAYPSLAAELAYRVPIRFLGSSLVIRLPLEYMFRGTYASAGAGLGASLEIARSAGKAAR